MLNLEAVERCDLHGLFYTLAIQFLSCRSWMTFISLPLQLCFAFCPLQISSLESCFSSHIKRFAEATTPIITFTWAKPKHAFYNHMYTSLFFLQSHRKWVCSSLRLDQYSGSFFFCSCPDLYYSIYTFNLPFLKLLPLTS